MNVPKLALSDVLTYNSNWSTLPTAPAATSAGSSDQPQPDLKLDWAPIEAYLVALHGKLATADTSKRQFADDAGATIDSIGGRFSSPLQTFSWETDGVSRSILDTSIPAAAVRRIEESGHTADLLFDGLQAGPRVAGATAGVSAETNTLRSLFEQAVNAGLVTKEHQRQSAVDATRSCLELSSGDSMDIYVKYNMTKKRRYVIDADVTPDNTGGFTNAQTVTLSFGGKSFDITLDTADADESSNISPYTYKVKLIAKEVEASGTNAGKITVAEGGSVFVPRV